MGHLDEPRVRETSTSTGIDDMVLAGPMFGSLAFSEIPDVVSGDTCDYVISYGDTFEEGAGAWVSTGGAYGTLQRAATPSRSMHANGTVDTNKVSFASGIKTIILTVRAGLARRLRDGGMDTDGLADEAVTEPKMAAQSVDRRAITDALWKLIFPTGTPRLTMRSTAADGFVMMNDGTVGDASSGASARANADCEDLAELLFDRYSDAVVPIFTSSGSSTTRAAQGSFATAWAAHCRFSLPKVLGRALGIAGAGSGLTSRALGAFVGTEGHLLGELEMPQHRHSISPHAHSTDFERVQFSIAPGSNARGLVAPGDGTTAGETITSGQTSLLTDNSGGNSPHNNMQPTTFAWNVEVAL